LENSFLENIVEKDKELLLYLNSFGNENWDGFWLYITDQFHWIPVFVIILVLSFLKLGLKKTLFLLVFLAVMIAFSDQLTNLVKHTTKRLRPCRAEDMKHIIRQFKYRPRSFSFWSGHAGVSTIVTTFIISLLRKPFKGIYLLILFPLFFGYSRIYLGVHYPGDVVTGYIMGSMIGLGFFKLFKYCYQKVFKEALV